MHRQCLPSAHSRSACLQARAWQDAGLPPLRVSVNVSALQLKGDGLRTTLAENLALDEALLRRDGSYPSGHAALGYGWSLQTGPAGVTFSNPTASSTDATFTATGTEQVCLTDATRLR